MGTVDTKFVRLNRMLAASAVIGAVALVAVQGPSAFRRRFHPGPKDRTLQSHLAGVIDAADRSTALETLRADIESTCDVKVSGPARLGALDPRIASLTWFMSSRDGSLSVYADGDRRVASAEFHALDRTVVLDRAALSKLSPGSNFDMSLMDPDCIRLLKVEENEALNTEIMIMTHADADGARAMLTIESGVVTSLQIG